MIDLHAHILPGLDDGSESTDESLDMAELALSSGVDTIVATPHSNQLGRFENYYGDGLKRVYRHLKRELERQRIPLKLYLGMEIFSSYDLAERIRRGMMTGLNASRYYLVEFEFDEHPAVIEESLRDILSVGKVPLIAHPERYFCVQDYPAFVYDWLKIGCFTQINKGSLFGRFGGRAGYAAERLLSNDLVTCVASDAHSPQVRTTFMADARDYLEEQFGEEAWHRLMVDNPGRIIRNEAVPRHGRRPESKTSYYY